MQGHKDLHLSLLLPGSSLLCTQVFSVTRCPPAAVSSAGTQLEVLEPTGSAGTSEVGAVVKTTQLCPQPEAVCLQSLGKSVVSRELNPALLHSSPSATVILQVSQNISQTIPPSSLIAIVAFCMNPVALVVQICLKPITSFKNCKIKKAFYDFFIIRYIQTLPPSL